MTVQKACTFFLLLFTGFYPVGQRLHAQQKIVLEASMFYNFSTKGEAGQWVDEQQLAGDPAGGSGGQPTTVFSPGWVNADIYYPAMVVLDLGKTYQLSSVWLFDANDSDSLIIFSGTPAQWQRRAGILLNTYNSWREVTLDVSTRFLMFRIPGPSTRVAEIVLYGTASGAGSSTPVPAATIYPMMQDFIGVNGFVDDPLDKLSCAGLLREYHNWGWDEGNLDTSYPGYPNNACAWNPSWVSGPGWGFYFDEFYQQLRTAGIRVSPDLQGSALYIHDFNDSLVQHKPISPAEDAKNPVSYTEHADYLFQFAARYGKTAVSNTLLKLRAGQPRLSGLGLTDYLENWNEPDKWWFTRGGYFTPDEFAAMCSADYDGHEGALGTTKGMKNADPQMKMVMAGLASLNLEYVRCMKLWSDYNRQGGFPADVLNFHHYSENGSHGISPEEDNLKAKLTALVDYRNTWLPGKEIWLSEFGYDTNPESTQAAVAIDTNDIYEVQGQWILRSFLAAAAAGIDKAFVFMLRDANAPDPNKYNSSGLTNEKWNGQQPKKSWYYVNTLTSQLRNTRFAGQQTSGHAAVNVYKFVSARADTAVYVVWCPTSANTVVQNFELTLGRQGSVSLITPMFGMPDGWSQTLPVQNGKVKFRVSERPVFIRVTGNNSAGVTGLLRYFGPTGSPLPATDLRLQLFDLQDSAISAVVVPQQQETGIHFEFDSLPSGQSCKIRIWEETVTGKLAQSWMWNHWNGITALDALLISYLVVQSPVAEQLAWISDSEHPGPFIVRLADVNNSQSLSALDALLLMYRLTGIPGMSPFPGGRTNFVVGGHFDSELSGNIFPDSPSILFDSYGSYTADAPASSVYHEAVLPPLQVGTHHFNIYFAVAGDLSLSAGL